MVKKLRFYLCLVCTLPPVTPCLACLLVRRLSYVSLNQLKLYHSYHCIGQRCISCHSISVLQLSLYQCIASVTLLVGCNCHCLSVLQQSLYQCTITVTVLVHCSHHCISVLQQALFQCITNYSCHYVIVTVRVYHYHCISYQKCIIYFTV